MQTNRCFFTFLFLIILIGKPVPMRAQEDMFGNTFNFIDKLVQPVKISSPYQSEVSFSIGGPNYYFHDKPEKRKNFGYYPMVYYHWRKWDYDKRRFYPTFDISYYHHLTSVFQQTIEISVGGSLGYGMSSEKRTNRLTYVTERYRKGHLLSMVGVKFGVHTQLAHLYCGAAGGTDVVFQSNFEGKKKRMMNAAFQITGLGVSFGRKVFGYGELGVGCLGTFRAGAGYRF